MSIFVNQQDRQSTKQKPNLVIFVPDEMRGDLVGNPHVQLPNLDALMQDGTTFGQCYTVNSVCAPSRCCTFTGQYPQNGGHRSLYQLLRPHEQNLFRLFKEAGYHVHYIGRNDLFLPETEALSVTERHGTFEETMAKRIQNAMQNLSPEKRLKLQNLLSEGKLDLQAVMGDPEIGKHLGFGMTTPWPEGHRFEKTFYFGELDQELVGADPDHEYIRQGLAFLDDPVAEPFVLYIGLFYPHPPYQVEEPYFSLYDRDQVPSPTPPVLDDKPEFMRMMHERYGLDALSETDMREIVATYYGMASRVDDQLGQVVEKLKETGLYDDTAILFFSDHGDYAGDYGLTEKWPVGFQDCLMRVPLVIKMPDQVGANQNSDALVELIDIFPTALEIADIETEYTHFGLSLLPLIKGEQKEHRKAVFGAGGYNPREPQCFEGVMPGTIYEQKLQIAQDHPETVSRAVMIRTHDYKLVVRSGGKEELYDLVNDPGETVNLIDDPAFSKTQTELRFQLLHLYLETSDNPHWERIRVM